MKPRQKPLGLQRGMSLIELMVGMTLGLLLLTALASLYSSTSQSRMQLGNSATQIENGRYALDVIGRELSLAGFQGESNLTGTSALSVPSICPQATNDLGYSNNPATVPVAVYGYATTATGSPGTLAQCLTGLVANTEILVVRRVSTTVVQTPVTGQAYMQVSFCANDTVPFVFSSTAADFTLHDKTCLAKAGLRQASVRVFYLANCDVCGNGGDNVPTLKMAELSAGSMQTNSVVQGIQDVHFSYGVDMDGNGSPDCYVSDPGVDNSAACTTVSGYGWANSLTNWSNVTSVRINVLARTLRPAPGWNDTRQYDLGRGGALLPAFKDGYKRHVYAEVARVANVAGPRE